MMEIFQTPQMDSALDRLGLIPSASGLVDSGVPKLDSVEQTRIGSWRADEDLRQEIDVS